MKNHQKDQPVQFIKDAPAVVWTICTSVGKDSNFHDWLITFQWVIVPICISRVISFEHQADLLIKGTEIGCEWSSCSTLHDYSKY